MAGGRYSFPYGPSPTDESLKLKVSFDLYTPTIIFFITAYSLSGFICLYMYSRPDLCKIMFSQAKYAAEYKATGQWKPPEQCSDIIVSKT